MNASEEMLDRAERTAGRLRAEHKEYKRLSTEMIERLRAEVERLTDTKEELWLPVVGWEGYYEVSNLGRVRTVAGNFMQSRKGYDDYQRTRFEKILSATSDKCGYQMVSLSRFGNGTTTRVHTLVLEAFVGPKSEGMECRHLDGDPANNRLENLAWGTPSENQSDKIQHGTTNRGAKAAGSILCERDVLAIRRRAASGENRKALADEFGVAERTVSAVVTRQTWAWLEECEDCGGSGRLPRITADGPDTCKCSEESGGRCHGHGWVIK